MYELDSFGRAYAQIQALDKRRIEYRRVGWVYILCNPALKGGLLKIGMTRVWPGQRATDLGRQTAVPHDFQVVYFVHVSDRNAAEALVHHELGEYRTSPRKEFFQVPLGRALHALDRAAATYPIILQPRKGVILEQPFEWVTLRCGSCSKLNRVRQLFVAVEIRCSSCQAPLGVDT